MFIYIQRRYQQLVYRVRFCILSFLTRILSSTSSVENYMYTSKHAFALDTSLLPAFHRVQPNCVIQVLVHILLILKLPIGTSSLCRLNHRQLTITTCNWQLMWHNIRAVSRSQYSLQTYSAPFPFPEEGWLYTTNHVVLSRLRIDSNAGSCSQGPHYKICCTLESLTS